MIVQKHFTDQLLVYLHAEFGPGNQYTLSALHLVNKLHYCVGEQFSHLAHPFLCTLVRCLPGKAISERNVVLEDLA